MSTDILSVGDTVSVRRAFGMDPPIRATIISIDLVQEGQKEGRAVQATSWARVKEGRTVVVDFGTYWAYGEQLDR